MPRRTDSEAQAAAAPTERTPLLASEDGGQVIAVAEETQITAAGDDQAAVTQGSSTAKRASTRQISPDLLRGLLMVFMAIDHANQSLHAYPHGTAASPGSEIASQKIDRWTNSVGYTLRILSHFCAPGFSLLLGMGLALLVANRMKNGSSYVQMVKHVVIRAFAILLANGPISVIGGLQLHVWILNIVLYALSLNYLLVGLLTVGLQYLERLVERRQAAQTSSRSGRSAAGRSITAYLIDLILVLLSFITIWWNIWLDPKHGDCSATAGTSEGGFAAFASPMDGRPECPANKLHLLYQFFFFPILCRKIVSVFPPLSWISFTLLGLLYGRLMLHRISSHQKHRQSTGSRQHVNITAEVVFAVVFACIFVATRLGRFGNLSNNCIDTPDVIEMHHHQPSKSQYLASFKAFLYTIKYPPSPAFAFLTLSANFTLLALFSILSSDALSPSIIVRGLRSDKNPLLVYGRQALFFYVVHLCLLTLMGVLILPSRLAFDVPAKDWNGKDDARSVGLGWVFLLSNILVLVVMYPLCAAYAKFKGRQGSESIWRFF